MKARTYNGEISADAVIKLPSAYDVALHRQPNGSYKVEVDYYTPYGQTHGAADYIGQNGKRLTQMYGIHQATLAARKLGHNVVRQNGKNGAVNLLISGGRL